MHTRQPSTSTSTAPPSSPAAGSRARITPIAFAALVTLNAGASLAIRFSYAEMPTFWSTALRFALGALVMWALVFTRKIPLPTGRGLLGAALFGALGMGASLGFVYWGLTKTPASLYQTVTAVMPLLTLLFATLHGTERFRWRGLAGGLVAVSGLALALGGSAGGAVSLLHLLAILAGAACTAEAGVLVQRFPAHPVSLSAVAMTVGAVLLAAVSGLAHEPWVLPSSTSTWLAFAYLVLVVTVGGFLLYLFVVGRWAASRVSYGFVLVPMVTVVLATTLAGERITWGFLAGGALVLLGAWLGALAPDRSSPPREAHDGALRGAAEAQPVLVTEG